ncbi:glycosyltransferase [Flavilitoribacter nigricans]|uniref:UDP-glucose--sterol glucosyltransferase n=1 Tax=Flavilitoribacter nigricans (strain ATCC 23147 / DSM 23189 / NBRC 102662 / NCIMB 1420 / SS-2) TaxID=1122177 RepID=A0A2D0NA81_FLAN2|nr:glycosyltransferase [Flavilitoribacter nigricans]PHN05387.1 UDP-glucose--sterol glucosyltransferase [Flavilitoribacter nigricans DSM 23189 = NBRC 102662]
MKILLASIGTRGDMEPFLAIGEILLHRGHDVVCLFPEQFRKLAEESGFRFASLGTEFLEMLESEDGKAALGGNSSGFGKFLAYLRLARNYSKMNKELIRRQSVIIGQEQPDRIVSNGKALYSLMWTVDHPGQNINISPVPYLHYVPGHSHLAFHRNFGAFLNQQTFRIANFGLLSTTMKAVKWLGLEKQISRKEIKAVIAGNRTIYTISPSLFPRPATWPDHLQVLGYHERDKTVNWQPAADLEAFLDRHEKLLLLTFGSMTNPRPEEKTAILLDILERNKIPALINTASGGLVVPKKYNRDLFYFVDQIPYDWVLPKVYAAVHHGGSGTTHMGLRHACATMIIPHIIDQFVWNRMVAKLGAGPLGVPIDKVSTSALEPKLIELFNNPAYKKNAERLGRQMQEEDFTEELYRTIVAPV